MSRPMKQEELDKIADVIWWIKGATAVGTSDFDMSHIEALAKAKDYHQDVLNGDRRCWCYRERDQSPGTICAHRKDHKSCSYPEG